MRALRALAGLLLLVAGWLWWRAPALLADLDRYSAAAHVAQARAARSGGHFAEALTELRVALVQEPGNSAARALWRALTARPRKDGAVITPIVAPPLLALAPHTPMKQPPLAKQRARQHKDAPRVQPSDTFTVAPALLARQDAPPLPPQPQATIPATASTAELGYAALATGNRRAAADAFRKALAETPQDPRAGQWRRQLAFLEKRWSGSIYALVRESGVSDLAATPVLGAGQSGGQLVYSLDPLSPRPLSLEARVSAPNDHTRRGLQAAAGITWKAAPHLALTAERLVRVGRDSRDAWTLRAAGGAEKRTEALAFDAYAEAGIVGLHDPATYAAVQGHVARRIGPIALGLGTWASVQHDARTVSRVEIGPSLRLRRGPLDLSADYRLRIAGNAAPGSGPAVTIAAYF